MTGRNNSYQFKQLRLKVLNDAGWECVYCGRYADTVDHVVPVSKGGADTAENLRAACKECNGSKSNKMPGAGGNWVNPRWR